MSERVGRLDTDHDCVRTSVSLALPERDGETVRLGVTLPEVVNVSECDGDSEKERDVESSEVADQGETVGEPDAEGLTELDTERETVGVAVSAGLSVIDSDCTPDVDALGVACDFVGVVVDEGESDGDGETDTDSDDDALTSSVYVSDDDGVRDCDDDWLDDVELVSDTLKESVPLALSDILEERESETSSETV